MLRHDAVWGFTNASQTSSLPAAMSTDTCAMKFFSMSIPLFNIASYCQVPASLISEDSSPSQQFLDRECLEGQFESQLQRARIARESLAPLGEVCRGWLNTGPSQITGNRTCPKGRVSDVTEVPSHVLGMVEDIKRADREFQVEALS